MNNLPPGHEFDSTYNVVTTPEQRAAARRTKRPVTHFAPDGQELPKGEPVPWGV